MPNFSSLAGLEVGEKFVVGWGGVGWGGVKTFCFYFKFGVVGVGAGLLLHQSL